MVGTRATDSPALGGKKKCMGPCAMASNVDPIIEDRGDCIAPAATGAAAGGGSGAAAAATAAAATTSVGGELIARERVEECS